jgi:predicted amidohydrolase
MILRAGFLQFDCKFGKKEYNFNKVRQLLSQKEADLFVLPELFNTGYIFTSTAEVSELAEPIPGGRTTQFLIELARRQQCTIVAGIAEQDGSDYFNSAVCVNQTGYIGHYRKIHLFNTEKQWFKPGNKPFKVYDIGSCKIGIMICFDWIFPEAARTLALKGAAIICHPSNLVLPYCQEAMVTRCLENHVFAITANRIGTENRGEIALTFTGKSEIVSPTGKILAQADNINEEIIIVEIDPCQAQEKNITPLNHIFNDRRPEFYS